MDLCDVAEQVNIDLENEWRHLTFYTRAAAMVQGFHRNHLSAFLEKQAQSELGHVLAFSKQVVALGGVPTEGYIEDVEAPTSALEILQGAIELEREVVVNYTARLRELETALEELQDEDEFVEVDDDVAMLQYLVLFYEEQIEDSHADLNNLREMVKGVN